MAPFLAARERLIEAIQRCEGYPANTSTTRRNVPEEAYPRLIHSDDEYRERNLALLREGYLVSKPFARKRVRLGKRFSILGTRRHYGPGDIPDDPRVLEPYMIRTHYYLETVDLENKRRPSVQIDEY